MSIEFNPETREFMLSYPEIASLFSRAHADLDRAYEDIVSRLASEQWFDSSAFKIRLGQHPCLQIFKYTWHPAVTPGCPWLHMEYVVELENARIVGRFDIETDGCSPSLVRDCAARLAGRLRTHPTKLLSNKGWVLDESGKSQVVLLRKSEPISKETLSRSWVLEKGFAYMNELSEIVEHVDAVVSGLPGPSE